MSVKSSEVVFTNPLIDEQEEKKHAHLNIFDNCSKNSTVRKRRWFRSKRKNKNTAKILHNCKFQHALRTKLLFS